MGAVADEPGMSEDADLSVGPPEQAAGGLGAVVSTLEVLRRESAVLRGTRALARVNQPDGFECPSCAWPEAAKPHRAEFCESGAKAIAEEATTNRVTAEFFARHPVAELGAQSEHWLGRQGRLTEPMLLEEDSGHYAPITWDDAFGVIAEELNGLDSPDEAIFYTSGRTSNEAAFLYQLFVRAFGTNNLPDCSNMCHESTSAALDETIGIGKGSVSLDDIHAADVIMVVGQNPGTNHPRMLTALETAKRRGARIIAVNPLPEAGLMRFKNPQRPNGLFGKGTALSDLFLQIRVNGDLALFKALCRRVLDAERESPGEGAIDRDFVASSCEGFKALEAELDAIEWDAVLRATGISQAEIDDAAELVLGSQRLIVCWAMGLTQHRNSVATIREIVNLLLLRGSIGLPGAGLCPVRGHSNVQGDRTMGIFERPSDRLLDSLERTFGIIAPRRHGHDTVDSIRAMARGDAHVFVAMGGNFVAASPDTDATAAALRKQRLTVQISTKLNRSHTVTGRRALILPTLGRTERDTQRSGPQLVSVEDSMSVIHSSEGRLSPASDELLSEVAIVCRLARAVLGPESRIPWQDFEGDYSLIRDRIEATIPGFEDYNARLAGGGFVLPHPPRDRRGFETPSGKAQLTVNELVPLEIPEGRLLLQTIRSHDQFNTTIYGLNDRYRGIKAGRRVVMVNPDDLARLGRSDGETVDIVSEWGEERRRVERFRVVSYPTARGCAAAYYPETNPLVPLDSQAEVSGTPTSKSVIVRLEPHA